MLCPNVRPYYEHDGVTLYAGDSLAVLSSLPAECAQTCVTSPPYWGLRDYGSDGQLGLELTPEEYVANMVAVFREVRRALRDDGTLWLNIGDCYANNPASAVNRNGMTGTLNEGRSDFPVRAANIGHRQPQRHGLKPKDLVGIPWRVAFALQADGWYLRSDIIWAKPNPMPESVTDRPTKAHEYLFLMSKSARYYYDAEAIAEPVSWGGQGRTSRGPVETAMPAAPTHNGLRREEYGDTRNRRSVWTVATQPFPGAHFAVFPPKLIEPCIKAGCPTGGVVLDPFVGSGTTPAVAKSLNCGAIGIDLSTAYLDMAVARLAQGVLPFGEGA